MRYEIDSRDTALDALAAYIADRCPMLGGPQFRDLLSEYVRAEIAAAQAEDRAREIDRRAS